MTDQSVNSDVDSSPEIDLTGRSEVTVGRSRSCTVALNHASVGRQHARLIISGEGVDIEDLDSRFGTSVNGTFIRRTRLKPGDLVRFGSADPYRFYGKALRIEQDSAGLNVTLSGVTIERKG